MRTELTVVVPVVNSSNGLEDVLRRLAMTLIKNSISAEVIIAADAEDLHLSSSTYENLSTRYLLKIRAVVLNANSGQSKIGRIVRLGVSLADSRFVFVLIPEKEFDQSFLGKALTLCRSGKTLVIANRFNEQNKHKKDSKKSFMQQKIFRILFRVLAVTLPTDSTNGTRVFDKRVFDSLAVSGTSWDMFAEHTIKTSMVKGEIELIDVEVPEFSIKVGYHISLRSRLFGMGRLTLRTIIHKVGLPWY